MQTFTFVDIICKKYKTHNTIFIMRIAFLVKIIYCEHTNKISYEKIDTFLETFDNQETLEIQIIKKYPTMTELNHCDCNIVYDKITGEKYLIVSSFL